MRPFHCSACGHAVFFENTACLHCGATLGWVPSLGQMRAFVATGDGSAWHPLGGRPYLPSLQPCATRTQFEACNWMLDPGEPGPLCASCRLTQTRPDLAQAGSLPRWAKVEQAKRRLLYGLRRLGLAPEAKAGPEDSQGLAFHFLAPQPGGPPVMTGHDQGHVTLNLDEADPVHRAAVQASFQEPWRTVLGHLRHEVAHYLHHRWIAPDPQATAQFREVFGDERQDYAQALQRHHQEGPAADWPSRHISAYASSHPHEDWAETCAHVLLVLDAVETAQAWGLRLDGEVAQANPDADALWQGTWDQAVLDHWLPVAQCLNAMNRSLGLDDGYPFQLPGEVLRRMGTVLALLRPRSTQPEAAAA